VFRWDWRFTTPDVGDDATDSDLAQVSENSVYRIAESAEFTVTAAGTTVVDLGIVAI
jgi:hypothetical protein